MKIFVYFILLLCYIAKKWAAKDKGSAGTSQAAAASHKGSAGSFTNYNYFFINSINSLY